MFRFVFGLFLVFSTAAYAQAIWHKHGENIYTGNKGHVSLGTKNVINNQTRLLTLFAGNAGQKTAYIHLRGVQENAVPLKDNSTKNANRQRATDFAGIEAYHKDNLVGAINFVRGFIEGEQVVKHGFSYSDAYNAGSLKLKTKMYDEPIKTRLHVMQNGNVTIGTEEDNLALFNVTGGMGDDKVCKGIHWRTNSKCVNIKGNGGHNLGKNSRKGGLIARFSYHSQSAHANNDVVGLVVDSQNQVGVGTAVPDKRLVVVSRGQDDGIVVKKANSSNPRLAGANIATIKEEKGSGRLTLDAAKQGKGINLYSNGHSYFNNDYNVGIGTTKPKHRLHVNGSIWAKELVTDRQTYPDYVFNDDYALMPLNQLEEYIQKNKHLPNIPSEKQVKHNGVKVVEMQAKLLEKIEELTLHTIAMNKEIIALKQQNKNLHKQVQQLKLATD